MRNSQKRHRKNREWRRQQTQAVARMLAVEQQLRDFGRPTSLAEIAARTPAPAEGPKQAYYSTRCCWWTTIEQDLAALRLGDGRAVACCPYCGSPLYQADLDKFIATAEGDPAHYGAGGLATLVACHSRLATSCSRRWPAEGGTDAGQ